MANVLVAVENMSYAHALADVLSASGHHVVTTSSGLLALGALRLSERRFVALLSETIKLHDVDGRDWLNIMASEDTGSAELARRFEDMRHAYILLTKQPPEKLSTRLRALVTYGKAALLDPNCSIATLIAAVELAAKQGALDEGERALQMSSA
jgi:hypothetical protein